MEEKKKTTEEKVDIIFDRLKGVKKLYVYKNGYFGYTRDISDVLCFNLNDIKQFVGIVVLHFSLYDNRPCYGYEGDIILTKKELIHIINTDSIAKEMVNKGLLKHGYITEDEI